MKKNVEICKFKKLHLKTKEDEIESERKNVQKTGNSPSPFKMHSSKFMSSLPINSELKKSNNQIN